MKNKLIFFFIYVFTFSFSTEKNLRDYQRSGTFFPEEYLSENDSLEWPIEFDISIDVKNIKGIEINSESFFAKLVISSYSKYDKIFTKENKEEVNLEHNEWFVLETGYSTIKRKQTNNKYFFNNTTQNKELFYDDFYSKYVWLEESPFDVNWDIRDYPFDTQQLKFKFTTTVDTSIIKLRPSKRFESTFSEKMYGLSDGIFLDNFSYEYEYNTDANDIIQIKPNEFRPTVTESLIFNLNMSRSGSWLFIKLFFGGILSFIISLFMFLLPIKEELESKFAIALGAIFGAVGNKYFIASEISGIQVFTKADFISNLIIFMVVFNMLVMILQASDNNNFKYFQSPHNILKFSSITFMVSFLLIIII